MSFRKYEAYKESGVEWLGEIPVGWATQKLKYVARIQPSNVDKKSKKDEKDVLLCNYTDVYYNEEITADLPFMKATASDVQIRKFTLKRGDTIITKDSEDPNDIAVPAYVPQDLEGVVCGYHLALLRPGKGTCGGYLKRVMDTQYARSVFATRANGITRYGLGIYAIDNFILPLPSLEEQKRIAEYLDKETTKIDTLIDKQEQLIALLQEKRQAIISHVVTRGLNPNVKMKDSGIEWLGKVPEHWVVTQIKYVAQINPSKSELKTIPLDTPVTFLPMESIGETGRLDIRNSKPLSEVVSAGYTYLAENDVIIAKITPCFENGKGAIATELLNGIAFATTEVVPFRCFRINNQFLYFLLSSSPFRKIAEGSMYGAGGQKRVSDTFFANYKCCIPPMDEEQKQIAAFINSETTKIDTLIEKCETAIELLKERRTALISATVTGKIDVRSAI